jgi:hypothetical protein
MNLASRDAEVSMNCVSRTRGTRFAFSSREEWRPGGGPFVVENKDGKAGPYISGRKAR